jgi:hypothetical protein
MPRVLAAPRHALRPRHQGIKVSRYLIQQELLQRMPQQSVGMFLSFWLPNIIYEFAEDVTVKVTVTVTIVYV